jgi:hypothetical protein
MVGHGRLFSLFFGGSSPVSYFSTLMAMVAYVVIYPTAILYLVLLLDLGFWSWAVIVCCLMPEIALFLWTQWNAYLRSLQKWGLPTITFKEWLSKLILRR